MKKIYGARDLAEAYFVKGLLDAEELTTEVVAGPLQAVLGEIPVSPESLPSVWIKDEDFDRAAQIIDEMKHGGPAAISPQPQWKCPQCGHLLEGQFTSCWNCGKERLDASPADAPQV